MIIAKKNPLSHYDKRKSVIDMIVFHSTCYDLKKSIAIYDEYKVSPHYVIDFNGDIIQCVDEKKRAFHAGIGSWGKIKKDINSYSIGIEVLNKTLGQTSFNQKQMDSLITLSKKIINKYQIPQKNIIGHSDIAPQRKADPGKEFPWKILSENGIGLWYDINDYKKTNASVKYMLKKIGYDTADIPAASYAFCRRFAPFAIDYTDIEFLLENPYPKKFDISKNPKALTILKAVYYNFRK